jgi:dTDP-4-dehydrorhamnose 3,5-epimerase
LEFNGTPLPGVFVVESAPREDVRGFFMRTFSSDEFEERGLNARVVQCNLSYNRHRGTVRGMHYQVPPATEVKLLRCIRGAVHSVLVDVRPASPTYLQHATFELSAENRLALYVPEMIANGMQTLEDDSEVAYQVSEFYTPDAERGLRYDDPALAISWPLPVAVISDKDSAWPLLETPLAQ